MATKSPTVTRLQITWSEDETEAIGPFAQAIIEAHRADNPDDAADDETILQRFCSDAILDGALQAQSEVAAREQRKQANERALAAQEAAQGARAVLIPQPDPEPEPAPDTDTETT